MRLRSAGRVELALGIVFLALALRDMFHPQIPQLLMSEVTGLWGIVLLFLVSAYGTDLKLRHIDSLKLRSAILERKLSESETEKENTQPPPAPRTRSPKWPREP